MPVFSHNFGIKLSVVVTLLTFTSREGTEAKLVECDTVEARDDVTGSCGEVAGNFTNRARDGKDSTRVQVGWGDGRVLYCGEVARLC